MRLDILLIDPGLPRTCEKRNQFVFHAPDFVESGTDSVKEVLAPRRGESRDHGAHDLAKAFQQRVVCRFNLLTEFLDSLPRGRDLCQLGHVPIQSRTKVGKVLRPLGPPKEVFGQTPVERLAGRPLELAKRCFDALPVLLDRPGVRSNSEDSVRRSCESCARRHTRHEPLERLRLRLPAALRPRLLKRGDFSERRPSARAQVRLDALDEGERLLCMTYALLALGLRSRTGCKDQERLILAAGDLPRVQLNALLARLLHIRHERRQVRVCLEPGHPPSREVPPEPTEPLVILVAEGLPHVHVEVG